MSKDQNYSNYHKAYQERRRLENRAFLNELKNVPCAIFGIKYKPWQMHFDHLDRTTKKFNVGESFRKYTKKDLILEEASKCRVLCANCHADVTYKGKHWNSVEEEKNDTSQLFLLSDVG